MTETPQSIDEMLDSIRDEIMAGDEALTQDELDELWVAFFIEDAEANEETTRRLFATILQSEARTRTAETALAAATARAEDAREALHQIQAWCDAYPDDAFPEPDYKRADEVLRAAGISMSAMHGSWARRIVAGIGEIARAAERTRAAGEAST